MRRVALRGIRAHLVRFVLSVLAVALGVAFVAGTFSLRTMLSATFTGIVESTTTADVYVQGSEQVGGAQPGASGLNPVPLALAGTLAGVAGVDHVIPAVQGPIVLVGADGTAVQSTQAPSFAFAYDPLDDTLDLTDGRAPEGEGEIAVEAATLESSGLALGDTTTVVLGDELRTVEVVGEATGGTPFAGATIVLLDADVATAAFAADGLVPLHGVYAEDGVPEAELVERVEEALAGVPEAAQTDVVTGDSLRADTRDEIDSQLGFVTTFLLVFAGISLFVGGFIIANTFAMSVRQRMREFALLRAVGASPAQVLASILVQAAAVGVLGSALGVAGGVGLVQVLKVVFERMGMALSGEIPLDGFTVVVSILVGTVVSVLAAALPARRAALVPPVEAMRDDVAVPERSLRVRAVLGSLAVVAGVAAVVSSLRSPEGADAGLVLGVGAGAVVIGTLLLSPVIARWSVGVLALPLVATVRPLGRLARGNVVRNPRRTANTAGALMIGMALVGASAVLAASAQASTSAIVEAEANADLILQSAGSSSIPAGAVDDVRAVPGVDAVDPFLAGSVLVAPPGRAPGPEDAGLVAGIEPDAVGRSLDVEAVDGSFGDALAAGRLAVQESAADDEGWAVGDELTVVGAGGTRTVEIGAVIDSRAIGTSVVLPADLFRTLVPEQQTLLSTAFVTFDGGADGGDVRAGVTRAVQPYVVVAVLDSEEYVSQIAAQIDQVLVILYALLGLSVVIAVLGIVNTLALSVIERTREIGLLRAVGLGRLQLAGTVTIESVLTAVFGTVVGLAVGVALASAMPTVFADEGLATLVVPWASLAAMLALAVVVGVLAAVWPGARAARLPVLEAISYE
ncbi:ABC transporter permease [Cellulomonas sp. NPDC055163]